MTEKRRWTLVSRLSDDCGWQDEVFDGPDLACGERIEVCPVSELDAALAERDALKDENARLVAGLESIAAAGTYEDPVDGTMLKPGAIQARIVLDGSTRPLERYAEQIAALRAELAALRAKAERLHEAHRGDSITLVDRDGRIYCEECAERWSGCGGWPVGSPEVHRADCHAAPDFITKARGAKP